MNYDLIKILCKRRGLSENKLAIDIGYSPGGYYAMIKKGSMPVNTLEKIAKVLNVQPSVFLKDREPKDINPVDDPEIKYINTSDELAPEYLLNKIKILEERVKELYDIINARPA